MSPTKQTRSQLQKSVATASNIYAPRAQTIDLTLRVAHALAKIGHISRGRHGRHT